jgi:hypothetical protein
MARRLLTLLAILLLALTMAGFPVSAAASFTDR